MNEILVDRPVEGVARVLMHAPDRRNAYTGPFARDLAAALRETSADESVAVMVLTGGESAFCAGAHRDLLMEAGQGDAQARADLQDVYDTFDALRDSKCVTIAAVCGPAVGAGFNLVLSCDVRVVAHDALLRSMFVANGIHPGGGHLAMLLQACGAQGAALMAALDEPLSGDDAVRLGLVYQALDAADVEPRALKLARRAAANPGLVRQIKESVGRSRHMTMAEAAAMEGGIQMATLQKKFAKQ